jgi:hypothetical protein
MQEELIKQEDELELTPEIIEPDEEEIIPILDIRQKKTWDGYVDPRSPTYGKAMPSAIAAGYSDGYAHNITSQRWFRDKLRRLNMLGRAERVLKKTLIMNTKDGAGKEQADLLRIQVDAAKHITKTLGKDEGYSERSEVTGKDGAPIIFMPTELMDKYTLPSGEVPKEVINTNQE